MYRLKKIVAEMAMTKDKKVQLDRTHTKGRGSERLFYCIRVDPRRSEEGAGGRGA